ICRQILHRTDIVHFWTLCSGGKDCAGQMLWNTGHCAQGAKTAQDRCCGILDTVLRGQRLRRTDVVEYWTLCSGGKDCAGQMLWNTGHCAQGA
ncbi:hypothetical protein LSAT2_006248, partial [Lamellibrachia satsuma]